jgi:hypothetical protein
MTDNQKARAWDGLKIAAAKQANDWMSSRGVKEGSREFLALMAHIEAVVLDTDQQAAAPTGGKGR